MQFTVKWMHFVIRSIAQQHSLPNAYFEHNPVSKTAKNMLYIAEGLLSYCVGNAWMPVWNEHTFYKVFFSNHLFFILYSAQIPPIFYIYCARGQHFKIWVFFTLSKYLQLYGVYWLRIRCNTTRLDCGSNIPCLLLNIKPTKCWAGQRRQFQTNTQLIWASEQYNTMPTVPLSITPWHLVFAVCDKPGRNWNYE